MRPGGGSDPQPRYGPFFRWAWAAVAVLAPLGVVWAVLSGDANDVLFTFGLVAASWSAVADAEAPLPDRARTLTGITLILGVVAAVVGLFIAPFE